MVFDHRFSYVIKTIYQEYGIFYDRCSLMAVVPQGTPISSSTSIVLTALLTKSQVHFSMLCDVCIGHVILK